MLVADDSAQNYREIYYYVVGDLECFVAEVKEYRDEATAAQENMEDTPEAVGAEIARTFTWNNLKGEIPFTGKRRKSKQQCFYGKAENRLLIS